MMADWDGSRGATELRYQPGPDATRASFTAGIEMGQDSIACRRRPVRTSEITRVFSGAWRGDSGTNALFDPRTDQLVEVTGDGEVQACIMDGRLLASFGGPGTLRIVFIDGFLAKYRGVPYYKELDTRFFKRPPAGWCSWYYYYENVTQDEICRNADWMAAHLKKFGASYIQLDDGYQTDSWTRWNSKFPGGGKFLADYIHKKGMKAGLWLTPYSTNQKTLLDEHPDWFIHNAEGGPVETFKAKYTIDASNPAMISGYLKPLFQTLALDWGFDYFKNDGQPTVTGAYKGSVLFDRSMDPIEAYRRGYQAIRDTVGENRYLLSCWCLSLEGVGIINASRIGGDVNADMSGVRTAFDCTQKWLYLNNIAIVTDPDVVCVREPLTLPQAQMWASLVALTGQLFMASDKMYVLPEDRVEVLRHAYPVLPMKPADLYPLTEQQTETLDLKIKRPFGEWDVVGLFNKSDQPAERTIDFKALGLNGRHRYHLYDFWSRRYLGTADSSLTFALSPASCRVISVHPVEDHPTLVSTSRHITQGGVDLKEVRWIAGSSALSGSSDCVEDDPYTLSFAFPPGALWKVVDARIGGREARVDAFDGGAAVSITPEKSGELKWTVRFEKAGGAPAQHPASAEHLRAVASDGGLTLSWEGPESGRFRVARDGKRLATVVGLRYHDSAVDPGIRNRYTVRAVDDSGKPFGTAASTEATAPMPAGGYLSDIAPSWHWQETGDLVAGKSVASWPMTLRGHVYTRGLGTHASSIIVYDLKGAYKRFTSIVGVDDETQGKGAVSFEVYVDAKKVFDSGVVTGESPLQNVNADLTGARELKLVVRSRGDGIDWDHADWADAKLEMK